MSIFSWYKLTWVYNHRCQVGIFSYIMVKANSLQYNITKTPVAINPIHTKLVSGKEWWFYHCHLCQLGKGPTMSWSSRTMFVSSVSSRHCCACYVGPWDFRICISVLQAHCCPCIIARMTHAFPVEPEQTILTPLQLWNCDWVLSFSESTETILWELQLQASTCLFTSPSITCHYDVGLGQGLLLPPVLGFQCFKPQHHPAHPAGLGEGPVHITQLRGHSHWCHKPKHLSS